jgi:small-conductance mechanosensitive channel
MLKNGFILGLSNTLAIVTGLLIVAIFTIIYFDPTQLAWVFSIFSYITTLIPTFFVLAILFVIFILLFNFFEYIIKKSSIVDDRSKLAIIQLSKVIWWALFLFLSAFLLLKNIDALITSLGLIGLGLTFALQKPVLNFVGWLTIITKDIYSEGDRIKIGNIRGDVKEIMVMNTVLYGLLETSDNRNQKIVTIPNELVLTSEVENYTKNSNYLIEELKISITYESEYKKAMTLLDGIITKNLKENIKAYINKEKKKKLRLGSFLKEAAENKKDSSNKEKNVGDIQKEIDDIQKEIEHLEEKGEDFKPKIRLEMSDSSLILIAQFLAPYNQIKKTRTEINIAFLDAIKKEKDIEVAYPHMELVLGKRAIRGIDSLKKYE